MQWPCKDDTAEQNAEAITVSLLLSHKKGEWTEDYNISMVLKHSEEKVTI